MRNSLIGIALLAACAVAYGDSAYGIPKCDGDRMSFNKNYRGKVKHQPERVFMVDGKEVVARSKKDAIKRSRHR